METKCCMFRKFGLLISLSFIVLNPNYVNAKPDFFCYMIDPDGFVFDLGALCGQIPSTLNLSGKYVGLHPTLEVSNSSSSSSNSRTPNANGNGIRIINITPGSSSGIITPSYSGSSGSSGSSGGSGGSGRCNKPTDRASDGSRCGGRAASER